jgi:hypothetical protein
MHATHVWKLVVVLTLLTLRGMAAAAPLTEEQYTLLRLDIQSHQGEFGQAIADNDDKFISDAYNLAALPECWVWRTKVPEQEVYEKTSDLPSTWDWDIYMGLVPGARDAWVRMHASGSVNAALPNTVAALAKLFKGADASQANHVRAIWRRPALRAERLYASTPGGACATTNPATLTWEGTLRPVDVGHALRHIPLP